MNIYLKNGEDDWIYHENISEKELLNRNISIGSYASIESGARIGSGASIESGARIGSGASIGSDAMIGSGARIGSGTTLNGKTDIIVISPIGSRNSALTGYIKEGKLVISTGCFLGTEDEFIEKLKITHGDNEHSVKYKSAIEFMNKILK